MASIYDEVDIKCQSQPFAEGRFREAYLGKYLVPRSKAGQYCVVKKNKTGSTVDPNGWDMCCRIQSEAQVLARGFQQYCLGRRFFLGQLCIDAYGITFNDVGVAVADNGRDRPKEYVIYEDYLDGSYCKWVNNFGMISPASKVLPAFSHWTWVHTKGEKMIADLQGVCMDDKKTYILTDPAILTASNGGQLGCADTGIMGMANFFINHVCDDNPWCNGLPRPTWNRVLQDIPQLLSTIDPTMLWRLELQLFNTVFVQELTSNKRVNAALISLFKSIARGG